MHCTMNYFPIFIIFKVIKDHIATLPLSNQSVFSISHVGMLQFFYTEVKKGMCWRKKVYINVDFISIDKKLGSGISSNYF